MQYEDINKKILEASFEVCNELGAGFLESVYEKALQIALKQKDFEVLCQVPLKVKFCDFIVGDSYADMLVEEKALVELKTGRSIAPEHKAQVINYLQGTISTWVYS